MELYDLNSFLDSIFYSRLQSKKAKDRKDAVDSLSKRIKQNPHFELSRPSLNELAEELIKVCTSFFNIRAFGTKRKP